MLVVKIKKLFAYLLAVASVVIFDLPFANGADLPPIEIKCGERSTKTVSFHTEWIPCSGDGSDAFCAENNALLSAIEVVVKAAGPFQCAPCDKPEACTFMAFDPGQTAEDAEFDGDCRYEPNRKRWVCTGKCKLIDDDGNRERQVVVHCTECSTHRAGSCSQEK